MSAMFQTSKKTKTYVKSSFQKSNSSDNKKYSSNLATPMKIDDKILDECIEFKCIPNKPALPTVSSNNVIKCPELECPRGYDVVLDDGLKTDKCPKYSCEPTPRNDAVCNVTGRTFSTFDGVEFKYDICNHLLARDIFLDKWSVVSKWI